MAKVLVGESLGNAKTAADGRKEKYGWRAQAAAVHINDAVRDIARKK